MGRKSRQKWLRRFSRMHMAGEVPKDRSLTAGFILRPGTFTRAEWDAWNARREREGRTMTLEERISKRFAEAQAFLKAHER